MPENPSNAVLVTVLVTAWFSQGSFSPSRHSRLDGPPVHGFRGPGKMTSPFLLGNARLASGGFNGMGMCTPGNPACTHFCSNFG